MAPFSMHIRCLRCSILSHINLSLVVPDSIVRYLHSLSLILEGFPSWTCFDPLSTLG